MKLPPPARWPYPYHHSVDTEDENNGKYLKSYAGVFKSLSLVIVASQWFYVRHGYK